MTPTKKEEPKIDCKDDDKNVSDIDKKYKPGVDIKELQYLQYLQNLNNKTFNLRKAVVEGASKLMD